MRLPVLLVALASLVLPFAVADRIPAEGGAWKCDDWTATESHCWNEGIHCPQGLFPAADAMTNGQRSTVRLRFDCGAGAAAECSVTDGECTRVSPAPVGSENDSGRCDLWVTGAFDVAGGDCFFCDTPQCKEVATPPAPHPYDPTTIDAGIVRIGVYHGRGPAS